MGSTMSVQSFASDNNAGVHPAVMDAMVKANVGHVRAYGDDVYTAEATRDFRLLFGEGVQVFFVYGGTGANVLGLSALLASHDAVICAQSAHINIDECGAPERFIGCKLLTAPTPDGKLCVEDIADLLHGVGDEHHVQPKVVSITQPTELGTVYTRDEVRAIADFAHAHGMYLHMDGARIANAAAALGTHVREFTRGAGVDVVSFGGTKNGMMYGEAVVFFDNHLAWHFHFVRKQGMQLASKMRFVSAQFSALLANDLWIANAKHANAPAAYLAGALSKINGIALARPVESNAVFVRMPKHCIATLLQSHFFYVWDEPSNEVRLMTSFDTETSSIDAFVKAVERALGTPVP